MTFIDTHSHVGLAGTFEETLQEVESARALGVSIGLMTTGRCSDFSHIIDWAPRLGWSYTLGLHPLFIQEESEKSLELLRETIASHLDDPYLIGVGEIGLDFYVEGLDREKQEFFFAEQLKIAQVFSLPVTIHARRSLYRVMHFVKAIGVTGGAIHAFTGSVEEAKDVRRVGLYLGVGGAVTYTGSKKVRKIVTELGLENIVLETDSPDMAPTFDAERSKAEYLPRYAQTIADLLKVDVKEVRQKTGENALNAFGRLCNNAGLRSL
ncbi:MAG: TatD family hydrolase [Candidatus Aphodousia sp.]|nr:TatD family hydrolase [Sutterella sp.]MDY2900317.1 TatD family hydrolase [Candidatus Aphodousia sp.]